MLKSGGSSNALTRYSSRDNLFYYFPSVDEPVYFPRCEYHVRFSSIFKMDKHEVYNTYHRSDSKRLVDVKRSEFKFLGNQSRAMARMYPKTGTFFSPFHFNAYQDAITPVARKAFKSEVNLYNLLLLRQKEQAAYIVRGLKKKYPKLKINADNQYTCVLVAFDAPAEEKNIKTWTNFVSVIYLAIVNKLTMEHGVNIETHLRSSFGTFRPSVAECGVSLRLSLGLVPKQYIDCVKQALAYTYQLVNLNQSALDDPHQQPIFNIKLQLNGVAADLEKYNHARGSKLSLKPTLWQTLWTNGDSKGCSFASQIFRKAHTTEHLIDLILDELLKHDLADIFKDNKKLQQAFANPISVLLNNYRLRGERLSFDIKKKSLKYFEWQTEVKIDDPDFWGMVSHVCMAWRIKSADLKRILKAGKTTHLHALFDLLAKQFTFHPNQYDDVEDGYGSDSDDEQELELAPKKKQTIHAKKFITATGMRAIQLSYAISKQCLASRKFDLLNIDFAATWMYYETDEALTRHPIPLIDDGKTTSKRKGHIGFFDLNHCNAMQFKKVNLISAVKANDLIAVVDSTSATTNEMNLALKVLYKRCKKLIAVLFVASGLKNEQGMSDYNAYGTVRIFAKSKAICQALYDQLVELEKEASYKHPKQSHLLRKTAKDQGMTPSNHMILRA